MNISAPVKTVVPDAINWGRGDIGDVRALVLDDFWDQYFEEFMIVFAIFFLPPSPIIDSL